MHYDSNKKLVPKLKHYTVEPTLLFTKIVDQPITTSKNGHPGFAHSSVLIKICKLSSITTEKVNPFMKERTGYHYAKNVMYSSEQIRVRLQCENQNQ